MAGEIPFFGVAVHAVLPYLKANPQVGDAELADPGLFVRILQQAHYPDVKALKRCLKPEDYNHGLTEFQRMVVVKAWCVIAGVVRYADRCWIERRAANGLNPDLVVLRDRFLVVLDVKTYPLHLPLPEVVEQRAHLQTVSVVKALQEALPADAVVGCLAGVLRIDSRPEEMAAHRIDFLYDSRITCADDKPL